jgi:uncharacterized protein YuzB (UPF0349 family)
MTHKVITFFKEQPSLKVIVYKGSLSNCNAMAKGYRKLVNGQVYKVIAIK